MMDAELKAKWVAALRSRDYLQGRSYLHRDDTFCCLGVLADISGCTWIANQGAGGDFPCGLLPMKDGKCISNVYGSVLEEPFLPFSWNDQEELTQKNDEGESFDEIADWIEKNL